MSIIDKIEKENLLIRKGGVDSKIIVVDDPKNKRMSTAKEFANKYKGVFQIGNKISASTPTVFIDGYELRFKDLKHKSGNKGNEYERFIVDSLKSKKVERNELIKLLDLIDIDIVDIVNVNHYGVDNKRRPLDFSRFIVKNPENPAEAIADITIDVEKNNSIKRYYISNKTSKTTTFVNVGIGSPSENNEKLKSICNWLEIDYKKAIDGFKSYNKDEDFILEPIEFYQYDNNKKIEDFLLTAIGWGYIYMSPENVFDMNYDKAKLLSSNPREFKIKLPGYNRKRLDVEFTTDGLEFVKINVRNKAGGLWPTHLMCDYRLK